MGCAVCAPTRVKRGCRGHRRCLLCAFQGGGGGGGKKKKMSGAMCRVERVALLSFTAVRLSSRRPQCAVQVKLELGHRAQVRKKPTVEGFTHDWMVFVRGPEHSNIQHFVEKVVFHLHESFPRPKRGRARAQKELHKKCLSRRRREQSPGRRSPAPRPASLPAPHPALPPHPERARPPAEPGDPGARRRAGEVPAPGSPACAGGLGCVKVTEQKSTVRCRVFIPPRPALAGPPGVRRGFCGEGAISCWVWGVGLKGINSVSSPLAPHPPPRNGRLTCVIGRECVGCSYCSFSRSRLALGSFSAFLPV